MIHILSGCITGYTAGTLPSIVSFSLQKAITFAVPAFIMSSAIKMSLKFSGSRMNYLHFIKDRIKRIYLPYIIWCIIYYLYFTFYRNHFIFNTRDFLAYILNGEMVAPFYFIIVIMQFYILMPLWLKIFKRIPPRIGIVVSIIITILSRYLTKEWSFSNRIILNYLMFWIIGGYIGSNYSTYINRMKKLFLLFIASTILVIPFYVFMAYKSFTTPTVLLAFEVMKMLFCALPSITLLLICNLIAKASTSGLRKGFIGIAKTLSPVTFYVYLIHCLIIFETDYIMSAIGINSVSIQFAIKFFVVYLLSFTLALLYNRIKNSIYTKKQNIMRKQ